MCSLFRPKKNKKSVFSLSYICVPLFSILEPIFKQNSKLFVFLCFIIVSWFLVAGCINLGVGVNQFDSGLRKDSRRRKNMRRTWGEVVEYETAQRLNRRVWSGWRWQNAQHSRVSKRSFLSYVIRRQRWGPALRSSWKMAHREFQPHQPSHSLSRKRRRYSCFSGIIILLLLLIY